MRNNIKKWLGAVLTLLIAFPVLAAITPREAQIKLEDQIFNLLQQGKYEQVKKTLENIPVCPRSGTIYLDQVPSVSTLYKFTTDPFKMIDSENTYIEIIVDSRKDPGFTKKVAPVIVRPVAALKKSLAREYEERFGKSISEYDEEGYLQFPEPYKDSWLEDVAVNFLAENIWDRSSEFAFYYDVKWHEAQGISMDEAADLKYALKDDSWSRRVKYSPLFPKSFEMLQWHEILYVSDSIRSVASYFHDEEFFKKYQQKNYYELFTMDNFSEASYLDTRNKEDFSENDYVAAIVVGFGRFPRTWEIFASKDMPEDLLKEMQANVAKHFPEVCGTEKSHYIVDFYWKYHVEEGLKSAEEFCEEFITNAKEYGLWTDEAQKKYDNLLGKESVEEKVSKQIGKRFLRSLKRTLHSIQNADIDLDDIEFAN